MADPLSIVASAAGVIAFINTVVKKTVSFAANVAHENESIREFQSNLETLQIVLQGIEAAFKDREKSPSFEQNHLLAIRNILRRCRRCICDIDEAIPKEASGPASIVNSFLLQWNSDLIVAKRAYLASYTQCLQVSMTTVVLVNQWLMQTSQEHLEFEISKLSRKMNEADVHFRRKLGEATIRSASSVDERGDIDVEKCTVSADLDGWIESTEGVTYAVTVYRPEQVSSVESQSRVPNWLQTIRSNPRSQNGIQQHPQSINSDTISALPDDQLDEHHSNHDNGPRLNQGDLSAMIASHQQDVNEQINAQLYMYAETTLQSLISLLRQSDGPDSDRVIESEEKLAFVLSKQRTNRALAKAETILKKVLTRLDAHSAREGSNDPNTRNLHIASANYSLAAINLELGRYGDAEVYGRRALTKRQEYGATTPAIDESYLLLASIYDRLGLAPSMRAMMSRVSQPPDDAEVLAIDVWGWLTERGFLSGVGHHSGASRSPQQVDPLNVRHPETRHTPLQFAIATEEKGQQGIVRALLFRGAQKEVADDNGATPLLLAATKRNKYMVKALLEKGVNTAAVDNQGCCALHRVQSVTGGTEAAKLLLHGCSDHAINSRDLNGRTPLHYAAGYGNELMVEILLSQPLINVHARDNAGDTPLHLAIYERRTLSLIKQLVAANDADVSQQNVHGKDALKAAQEVRPRDQMKPIIEFLEKNKKKKRTSISTSRTTRTESRTASMSSKSSRPTSYLHRDLINESTISLPWGRRSSVSSSTS